MGEVAVMEVIVEAKPKATFHWFQDIKQIVGSRDLQVSSQDNKSSLIISEVFEEDAGQYRCIVENIAGSVTTSGRLFVEGYYFYRR